MTNALPGCHMLHFSRGLSAGAARLLTFRVAVVVVAAAAVVSALFIVILHCGHGRRSFDDFAVLIEGVLQAAEVTSRGVMHAGGVMPGVVGGSG